MLSGYPVDELELAVARDDVKKFESISGIGKKLAQRLVVELKDKVGAAAEGRRRPAAAGGRTSAPSSLARSALQNLGLSLREAEEALRGAPDDAPLEDLVKYALKRSKEADVSDAADRPLADPHERADDRDLELTLRPRASPTSSVSASPKSSSRSSCRPPRSAATRSTTCSSPGLPASARRRWPASSPTSSASACTPRRGPALERKVDVAGLLTNLQEGDVLFVDEIHRLNAAVEEVLYPAMEDFEIDIMIGEGPAARSIRMPVPPFTLIGATTRTGLLTTPLRDRFGVWQRLEYYEIEELAAIVRALGRHPRRRRSTTTRALEIAGRSRGTPRVANRLLRRVRDFAEVRHDGRHRPRRSASPRSSCSRSTARASTSSTATSSRRSPQKFDGGPVGLDTLAVALGEEADTLQDVYEPYLIMQGFLKRTPRGRVLTRSGFVHCGLTPPAGRHAVRRA